MDRYSPKAINKYSVPLVLKFFYGWHLTEVQFISRWCISSKENKREKHLSGNDNGIVWLDTESKLMLKHTQMLVRMD